MMGISLTILMLFFLVTSPNVSYAFYLYFGAASAASSFAGFLILYKKLSLFLSTIFVFQDLISIFLRLFMPHNQHLENDIAINFHPARKKTRGLADIAKTKK